MARREVLEIKCDRCGRVETQGKEEILSLPTGGEFAAKFHGQEVRYPDLCRGCRQAVANYWKKIVLEQDPS